MAGFKVPILMYHMVNETNYLNERRYCCSPKIFRKQMAYLKRAKYRVIGLDELVNSIRNGDQLLQKSIVITLDDGFRDNYHNAFPVLQEFRFPATIFAVSRFLGHSNVWMQKEGYPTRKLLTWKELKKMATDGITIGAHTMTHALLTDIGVESTIQEIEESKRELEDGLEKSIHFFAYPYGRFNKQVKNVVKEAGYLAACSVRSGFNSEHTDPYALRRIDVYGTDTLWKFALKIRFGANEANLSLPIRYYLGRLLVRLQGKIKIT